MSRDEDLMMAAADGGILDIQFTKEEIKELIRTLDFAATSASVLAEQELRTGTFAGSNKMTAMMHNAEKLLNIVVAAAQIGSPDYNSIN